MTFNKHALFKNNILKLFDANFLETQALIYKTENESWSFSKPQNKKNIFRNSPYGNNVMKEHICVVPVVSPICRYTSQNFNIFIAILIAKPKQM